MCQGEDMFISIMIMCIITHSNEMSHTHTLILFVPWSAPDAHITHSFNTLWLEASVFTLLLAFIALSAMASTIIFTLSLGTRMFILITIKFIIHNNKLPSTHNNYTYSPPWCRCIRYNLCLHANLFIILCASAQTCSYQLLQHHHV